MVDIKKEREDVMVRARVLKDAIQEIYEDRSRIAALQAQVDEWVKADPEARSGSRRLASLMFAGLHPQLVERVQPRLVYGIVNGVQHAWFVVEGDPRRTQAGLADAPPFTEEQIAAAGPMQAWRYVLDPAVLDGEPVVLLLSPYSPLSLSYGAEERFTKPEMVPVDEAPPQYEDTHVDERAELMRSLGLG